MEDNLDWWKDMCDLVSKDSVVIPRGEALQYLTINKNKKLKANQAVASEFSHDSDEEEDEYVEENEESKPHAKSSRTNRTRVYDQVETVRTDTNASSQDDDIISATILMKVKMK